MKNIFKTLTVLSVLLFILTTSCTKKERTWLADIQVGAFIAMEVVPDLVQGVNTIADLSYEAVLYDPTGNVAEYELTISAILAGNATPEYVLGTYTTFPINLALTATDLAAALNVTLADINFGDSFAFTGVITHRNGTVYTGDQPTFNNGVYDPGGLTDAEIVDPTNGYRNGFAFGFTIGCPGDTYNSATIPGNWHAFSASWPADGTVVFSIDAADPNTMLVAGMAELDGMVSTPTPMRMTVDPATNAVAVDPTVILAINFYGYDNMFLTGGGTIFPCAGNVIDIPLQYHVDQGSFGTYGYIFTPM